MRWQDEETGLYYYGARYYDPITSVWQSVDPPILGTFLNGEHNGGIFNSKNLSIFSYTYQNPIRFTDPNGKQTETTNPIGEAIVENYNSSSNQTPGGLCYAVAKIRFAEAYNEVMGSTYRSNLTISNKSFQRIWNSASGNYNGWTSLPLNMIGRGGAGAIAMAGFGEIKNQTEIWNGELTPGAILQTWSSPAGHDEVVTGVDENGFEGIGHSFIFLEYTRDENDVITGMNIADQGYQNNITLTEDDYDVLYGANITASPPMENETPDSSTEPNSPE